MVDWMLKNRVATAFILGMLTIACYATFVMLDVIEDAADDAADADDEKPAEVKHARRAARGA